MPGEEASRNSFTGLSRTLNTFRMGTKPPLVRCIACPISGTTPVRYNNVILSSRGSLGVHYLLCPSFQGRYQHALGYLLLTSILVLRYEAQQRNLVFVQS